MVTTSRSPYSEEYRYEVDDAAEADRVRRFAAAGGRKVAVVMGLGFVGSAMTAALARVRTGSGKPLYNVVGVDLPDPANYWKIARTNSGLPPVISTDAKIDAAYAEAVTAGNLLATYSREAFSAADYVVVDIHLDIQKQDGDAFRSNFSYDSYKAALRTVAERLKPGALVLIETTVPPGTTEKVIYPLFLEEFNKRGLNADQIRLGHSYERVMPGPKYLDSVTDFYRVYSAIDTQSKSQTREFLESFINVKDFPLSELASPTASEMAKVLENSFRAANIAFIQEWTDFADQAGVNLFEVTDAIRVRPTHRNIMRPGFGVGGYCLTKDSLLADWAFRHLFGSADRLGVSLQAVGINDKMPLYALDILREALGSLAGKTVLVLGVSYLGDVSDTRFTPTELFYDNCTAEGATVLVHDPLVKNWPEKNLTIPSSLEDFRGRTIHAVLLATQHSAYKSLTAGKLLELSPHLKAVIDANNVLADGEALELSAAGVVVRGVGKGHWKRISSNG